MGNGLHALVRVEQPAAREIDADALDEVCRARVEV
jgi:hypothetical protein